MKIETQCFHCGLPLPASAPWRVRIDGIARAMCCPGCEAVAQAIVDNHFDDYYRERMAYSAQVDQSGVIPPQLKLLDTPEDIARHAVDEKVCETIFSVDGIRCPACVWLIEKRLRQVPGLLRADMNVATERLVVRWSKDLCKPSNILAALHQIGYAAYPFDPKRHSEQLRRASKTLSRQLFIAALAMAQAMMYSVPVYLATDGTMDGDMTSMMRWAGLLLTIPAVFYSALPFFKGAWSNIKQGALGMDVPVALGIAAAFISSVNATLRGHGEVYFDSMTMFIFLLLCSRYLELAARRKAANTLEKLQHALPESASRLTYYPDYKDADTIAAAELIEGDFVLVKPGEALAADAIIVEGSSSFDVSLLTGETQPLQKKVGDFVPGGALNAGQAIIARVSKPARDSTLSMLMKLIERAGQAKPKLSLWADKVAAWFVAALLLFAVLVFFTWQVIDPTRAWPIAIALLVVSCPCALSLATPTALAASIDRLLRQGVLVIQPHVLETLHNVTHIIFDKTGTLTVGKPVLQRTNILGSMDIVQCLQITAAMETSNAHPLSAPLVAAASRIGAKGLVADAVRYVAGQGLEGTVKDITYRLGNLPFVQELCETSLINGGSESLSEKLTSVYLGHADGWCARFDLADPLRDDAHQVIEYFQASGKTVILLSGDQHAVTQHIASQLGIGQAHGEFLPEQKLAFVQDLQSKGAVVAMVGDGINDAAVLRAADVSFAMGSGAALAQAQADAVLLSGRLSAVSDAARAAKQTMAVIRQNLAWAMLYNLIAIPAAAFGLLNPWMTGIGMSVSSAIVVLNALRLRRVPKDR